MNELTLKELDMGMATPRILRASSPSVDSQGEIISICFMRVCRLLLSFFFEGQNN